MKHTNQVSGNRRGTSLMEMVIVMTVIAGLAAMSWPMLKSPLSKLRLQAAAQEVTSELAKARLKAMQSGVPQVFRIQMNTGKFQVTSASDDDDKDESNSDSADMEMADTTSTSGEEHSPLTDSSDLSVDEKELPDGVCFACPLNDETPVPDPNDVAQSDEAWTDLAVFYPNGDTTNAVVSLRGQTDLHLDVKLSALTGTAKIGETHRQEWR